MNRVYNCIRFGILNRVKFFWVTVNYKFDTHVSIRNEDHQKVFTEVYSLQFLDFKHAASNLYNKFSEYIQGIGEIMYELSKIIIISSISHQYLLKIYYFNLSEIL